MKLIGNGDLAGEGLKGEAKGFVVDAGINSKRKAKKHRSPREKKKIKTSRRLEVVLSITR